jgi:hypothetical protein
VRFSRRTARNAPTHSIPIHRVSAVAEPSADEHDVLEPEEPGVHLRLCSKMSRAAPAMPRVEGVDEPPVDDRPAVVLTSTAVGFIRASAAASIRWCVSSVAAVRRPRH